MSTPDYRKLPRKPLRWVGSSLKDIRALPEEVQATFGLALDDAQLGEQSHYAKPLTGFGGAGVVEISESLMGSTFRAVYTVKFAKAVYVLHIFQKKSKTGRKTPKGDVDLIHKRLKAAEADYADWSQSQSAPGEAD